MTVRRRAVLELVLAALAAAGCVACWLASRTMVVNLPVRDGEPTTTSVVYYPPLLMAAFALCAIAGVLVVVGVFRWRRAE